METKEAREFVENFIKEQVAKGVKRAEIARSLFAKGYSCSQVALVMNVHPKTAHAYKINFSKEGKAKRVETGHPTKEEFKNYLRGSAIGFNAFYSRVNAIAGKPYHTKAGKEAREKAKAEATATA